MVRVVPAATVPRPTLMPVPVKLPESASAASVSGAPSRVSEPGCVGRAGRAPGRLTRRLARLPVPLTVAASV